MSVDVSHDPRTGNVAATVAHSTPAQLERAVAAAVAAGPVVASTAPAERREWMTAIADALEQHTDELARLADWETGLGVERLRGEVARTAGQLRFYADVAVEGSYLGATIDSATVTAPSLARVAVPMGPVAVFGASNFPFAFSVLGNDTASALAAGCPVVVKAHPAHLAVSQRTFELASAALTEAGAPEGTLGIVFGFEAGTALVKHDAITAVGFTGSQAGGMALWRLANERDVVIPVYAEMGTVNPVVVTPAAATADLAKIAEGLVGSFTLGSGQFCTKPGLLLVPTGLEAATLVAEALTAAAPSPLMLTERIASTLSDDVRQLEEAGATVVGQVAPDSRGWGAPAAVLEAPAGIVEPGNRTVEECFGAVVLVVEYTDVREAESVLDRLQGALAGSVFATVGDPDAARLLEALGRKVGRVILNGWPTGVAYTWAQHHGGPWPATSNPSATSVGAGALQRFVRPVAHQGLPDELLPAGLRAGNPWGIVRWVDGAVQPATHPGSHR